MISGKSCGICKLVGLLVAIGAINWGLVGAFQVDLVQRFLGGMPAAARTIYIVIGIAGLLKVLSLFKCCPCSRQTCETKT